MPPELDRFNRLCCLVLGLGCVLLLLRLFDLALHFWGGPCPLLETPQ